MCVCSHERETAVPSHRVWGRKERTEGQENEMTVSVFRSQETLVSKRRIFMSPDCVFSNCQTKDWWTYEFCYGRHIQQYHMEGELAPISPRPLLSLCGVTGSLPPSLLPSRPQNDNVLYHMPSLTDSEVKGDVLYLGYYQSAFNWDDETAKVTGVRDGSSSGNRGGSDLAGVFPGVWCPSRPSALGPRSLCTPGSCGRLASFYLTSFPHTLPIPPDVFSRPPSSIG